MILLEPIDDGSDTNLTPDELNKVELLVLEEEAKNAAVAKEYLANKKKPFYHPEHYYEMSACKFNVKKHRAIEPTRKDFVELSDEEYLFLLTKVLTFGSSYLFKYLYEDRPEMAKKIIEKLYGCYEDGTEEGWGYHVTFDEVFENAKEIVQLKDYYMPGNPNSTMTFF